MSDYGEGIPLEVGHPCSTKASLVKSGYPRNDVQQVQHVLFMLDMHRSCDEPSLISCRCGSWVLSVSRIVVWWCIGAGQIWSGWPYSKYHHTDKILSIGAVASGAGHVLVIVQEWHGEMCGYVACVRGSRTAGDILMVGLPDGMPPKQFQEHKCSRI